MEKVVTPVFRASFAHVFKSHAFSEKNEPKYSVVMLFDKSEDISGLKKLAAAAVEKKWPDKEKRPQGLRNPFRDGDVEKPNLSGYAGTIFVTATSKQKPDVVDQNMDVIIDPEDFYSGCFARASVTAYAYDNMGNRGVSFGLQNLQKVKDGEAFTGRSKAEDDFEAIQTDSFLGAEAKSSPANEDMFT